MINLVKVAEHTALYCWLDSWLALYPGTSCLSVRFAQLLSLEKAFLFELDIFVRAPKHGLYNNEMAQMLLINVSLF